VIFCVAGVGCKGMQLQLPGVGGVAAEVEDCCAKALAVKERMAMVLRGVKCFFMMDGLYRTSLVQEMDLT
jgi:hypothetical protein